MIGYMTIVPSEEQKSAWARGYSDYLDGKTVLDCPYPANAKNWKGEPTLLPYYWHGGWQKASEEFGPKQERPRYVCVSRRPWERSPR